MFISGKDEEYAWDKPKISAALTDEQKAILQKRGVLSPAELHRLASKTRASMLGGEAAQRAACHSDVADDETAKTLQDERLHPETLEPLEAR